MKIFSCGMANVSATKTRKFEAKRVNEHVKSFYAFANTLSAAIIVTAFIAPAITRGSSRVDLDAPGWVFVGILVHAVGQIAIRRYMKAEE